MSTAKKGNQNAAKDKNKRGTDRAPVDSKAKEAKKSRTKKAARTGVNRGAQQRANTRK
jgi:hypothetical protein